MTNLLGKIVGRPVDFPSKLWYKEGMNQGIVVGLEAMFSFGSSQFGLFWYIGPQLESGYSKYASEKEVVEGTLYTGYVYNLWNCYDYTGDFIGINSPWGSFFFDPGRVLDNSGPWGASWPILSKRFLGDSSGKSYLLGGNATTFRYPFVQPENVSYGKLAVSWGASQMIMMSLALLDSNQLSTGATFVGLAATGVMVKSKQIYNQQHNFYPDPTGEVQDALYERRYEKRPPAWRSGFENNPLSWMIGSF
jgi:hypothetical protein